MIVRKTANGSDILIFLLITHVNISRCIDLLQYIQPDAANSTSNPLLRLNS